jgi:hypothetical protein
MTRIAGYMTNPENLTYDERVAVSRGLRTKDLVNNNVVLNITKSVVEKNSFRTDKSFMEMFEYFYENNADYISQALRELGVTVEKASTNESVQEQHEGDVQGEGQASEGSLTAAAT